MIFNIFCAWDHESSTNLEPADHLSKPLQDLCPHPLHKLDAPDNEMPAAVYASALEFIMQGPHHLRDVHENAA